MGTDPAPAPTQGLIHEAIACLGRLVEAFQLRREQLAAEVGLTDHQWGVLEEIATEHFMPSMFARQRNSSAAAVSKTLRQLVDKGLVTVSVAKEDGRQRHYTLTPKGRRTMEALRERRQRAIAAVWAQLDPQDLKAFTRFGSELSERLEQYAQQPLTESTQDNGKVTLRKGL